MKKAMIFERNERVGGLLRVVCAAEANIAMQVCGLLLVGERPCDREAHEGLDPRGECLSPPGMLSPLSTVRTARDGLYSIVIIHVQ